MSIKKFGDRAQHGLTLVETTFAVVLLSIVMWVIGTAIMHAHNILVINNIYQQVQSGAAAIQDKIAQELTKCFKMGDNFFIIDEDGNLANQGVSIRFQKVKNIDVDGTITPSCFYQCKRFAEDNLKFKDQVVLWRDINNSGEVDHPHVGDSVYTIAHNCKSLLFRNLSSATDKDILLQVTVITGEISKLKDGLITCELVSRYVVIDYTP